MNILYILIPLFILVFFFSSQAQNPLKYKYLFRNKILSKSKTNELAPVLRGRVYYPRYFYIPSLKQYLVYSDLDETGPFNVYERVSKPWGKAYAFLDENGNNIITFETSLRFSYRSGCFYGSHTYIPFYETGKSDTLSYYKIHNANLDLGSKAFEKLFQELYVTSEYIEFINLRASGDDIHQAGVIFKRDGKFEILLSGLRDSRMERYFQEDRTINNSDDYYEPQISNKDRFPQSAPSIHMIPLKTNNTNPFVYWRTGLNRTIHIKKYSREYSSGWQGIAKVHGIPVYLPGEVSGTAYIKFKTKSETFLFKVLDVEKSDFIPAYHLGLRTFELPDSIRTPQSLVFMESVQNSGSNRLGGGVFVVRPTTNTNPSADIPPDLTEEYFNTLPFTLQVALLDPEHATSLKIEDRNITTWIPELERLKNLKHLELTTGITEIPDAIATFTKLETLSISNGKMNTLSPKLAELTELRELDIHANKLTSFPISILQLKKLTRLNIGYNNIGSLPDEICSLVQLENLNINSAHIDTIPVCLIGLKNLYISCDEEMKEKLPPTYNHLFDYMKQLKY